MKPSWNNLRKGMGVKVCLLVLLVVLLGLAGNLSAQAAVNKPSPSSFLTASTYYVSPSGDDNNPGTINSPWKTPGKAGTTAQAGDTVIFRGGEYYGQLAVKNSGNPIDGWITFKGYPGEVAKIISSGDGVSIRTPYNTAGSKTYDEMMSYIEVSNLDIQGGSKGVRIDQAHHIRLINNVIHDTPVGGLSAPNGNDHVLVEGNVIYGNSTGGPPCSSGISFWNTGCFWGEGAGCKVLNDGAPGYHIIIRNNIIYSNRNDDSGCGFPNPSDGNGIILDNNGDDMPLTLIVNNLIYHNGGRCIQSLNSDNAHIIHNTCWENLQTERMQNNGSGEILLDEHEVAGASMTFDNVIVKNNVIYGRGDGCPWQAWGLSEDGYESDYNLWYQDDADGDYYKDWSNILNKYRGCGWNHGLNEIIGSDPIFVSTLTCTGNDPYYDCDWESLDFNLQSGSPAIDSGTDQFAVEVPTDFLGILRPSGGGFDMGAYELFSTGVTLEQNQAATQLPGTIVNYTFTVTNDTNEPDTFVLDVPSNPLAWTVVNQPGNVNLQPGASTTVGVSVEVPADAAGGVVNGMTVRATSQSDGAVLDIATLDVTVEKVVELFPDNQGSATGGTDVVYVHTVENTGNGTDTFNLSAVSSQGWPVILSDNSVTLAAGDTANIQVTVSVPVGANAVDVTTVRAVSGYNPGVSDTATDTTQLGNWLYLPIIARK